MHIKPFTPRLIGVEQIANFRESQLPTSRRLSPLRFGFAHRASGLVFAKGNNRHENQLFAYRAMPNERPRCRATLQERIDDGRTLTKRFALKPVFMHGPILINKPLALIGEKGAEIRGNGAGNVVTVRGG